MDFAALMAKEMGKTKKTAKESNGPAYLKRSEVEAERKRQYEEDQKNLEAERVTKAATKRKIEEDAATETAVREEKRRKMADDSRQRREERDWEEERKRRLHLGLPALPRPGEKTEEQDDDVDEEDIPEEELVTKLRLLGEPTTLFAEKHAAKLKRYRKLTTVMTDGPIPTTLELVEEKDMKVAATVPQDKEGRRWLFRQLASYFTMVVTAYQGAMEAEKLDTAASKNAYSAMVQTRDNLKPVRIPQRTQKCLC